MGCFKGVPEGVGGKVFAYIIVPVVLHTVSIVFIVISLALAFSAYCEEGSDCNAVLGMTYSGIFSGILHTSASVVGFKWLLGAQSCHGTGEGCCGSCCGGCCDNGTRAMFGLTITTMLLNFIAIILGGNGLPFYDGQMNGAWTIYFLMVFMPNLVALVFSILHKLQKHDPMLEDAKTEQSPAGQSHLDNPLYSVEGQQLPQGQSALAQEQGRVPPPVLTMQATSVVATPAIMPAYNAPMHVMVPMPGA